MAADRMFRVIVLGGIALTASSACGGSASSDPTTSTADTATTEGAVADTFPTEGPAIEKDSGVDTTVADTTVGDTSADADGFPKEGPDTSMPPDTAVVDSAKDTFPKEGPMMIDASG